MKKLKCGFTFSSDPNVIAMLRQATPQDQSNLLLVIDD
jgi:hypothetical protein